MRLLLAAAVALAAGCRKAETAAAPISDGLAEAVVRDDAAAVKRAAPAELKAAGAMPLMEAAIWGRVAAAKALLDAGAPADVADKDGDTPLMAACGPVEPAPDAARKDEVAKLLLARGANPNRGNKAGLTPLMVAAAAGRVEAVRLLLAAKADPAPKLANGRDALALAETAELQGLLRDAVARRGR